MAQNSMADLGGGGGGLARFTLADLDPLYRKYLGRPATPADYAAHQYNPGGLTGVERAITASPEYAQRQTTTPSNTTVPGVNTTVGTPRTGWGYNAPTGGRAEFSYTPQSYAGGWGNFYGFRDMDPSNFDDASYNSAKYVVARAAQGLGEGPNGFDEAGVDELVRRLNAQGIPAKKIDAYQIDLGLGEGPIQVRHSSNKVWWNNRATENAPAAAFTAPAVTPPTEPGKSTLVSTTPGELVSETPAEAETPAANAPSETTMSDTIAPYFASMGVEVLEVRGNRMRVLTEEDKQAGKMYGRWVDVTLPDTSMADLGR